MTGFTLFGSELKAILVAEREHERELCAESAMDWFTLPPKLRTKAKLREMILNRSSK